MKLLRKLLAAAVVLTSTFFALGNVSFTHAQNAGCLSGITLNPNSGSEDTIFTLSALGCEPGNIYRLNVLDSSGNPVFSYTPQASNIGELSQAIQGLSEGTYEIRFFNASDPIDVYFDNITVTPSQDTYQCGQAVPPSTPTCSGGANTSCCPADCPSAVRFAAGSGTGNGQQMCSCGRENERKCEPGNALNLPACEAPLSPNAQDICVPPTTGASNYYCGEEIYSEDVASGNFICATQGCPVRALPGGRLWCGCGEVGDTCCPEAPTDTTETNFIAEPGCRGLAVCNAANLCLVPTKTEGTASQVARGCSGGLGQVNTAIGCIPFEIVSQTASFFLAWSLSIGGGIALLLIAISAFMFATSSGIPDKVKGARDLFTASTTGLIFLVLSVFLLRFIGVDILGLFG